MEAAVVFFVVSAGVSLLGLTGAIIWVVWRGP